MQERAAHPHGAPLLLGPGGPSTTLPLSSVERQTSRKSVADERRSRRQVDANGLAPAQWRPSTPLYCPWLRSLRSSAANPAGPSLGPIRRSTRHVNARQPPDVAE